LGGTARNSGDHWSAERKLSEKGKKGGRKVQQTTKETNSLFRLKRRNIPRREGVIASRKVIRVKANRPRSQTIPYGAQL